MDFIAPTPDEIAAYHDRIYAEPEEFVRLTHDEVLASGITISPKYDPKDPKNFCYVRNKAGHIGVFKKVVTPDGAREKVCTKLGHMLDAEVSPVLLTRPNDGLGRGVISLIREQNADATYFVLLNTVDTTGIPANQLQAHWAFTQNMFLHGTQNNRLLQMLCEVGDTDPHKHLIVARRDDGSFLRYQVDFARSLDNSGYDIVTDHMGWTRPTAEYAAEKLLQLDPADMLTVVYGVPMVEWGLAADRERAIDTLCGNYESLTGHEVPKAAFRLAEMRTAQAPKAPADDVDAGAPKIA